jgi:hypothetical protein
VNIPGAWKRWLRKWQWEDRARGFDKAKADQLGLEIEERRRERLEQLLELDRDVHLPQIIALGKKIDELIQVGLAKTTSVNPNTGVTQSLDRAQVFQLMAAERRELTRAYFDLARPLLEVPAGKRGKDEDQPVAMIGRFEWLPDPEVPEPTPVPAIETSKDEDD